MKNIFIVSALTILGFAACATGPENENGDRPAIRVVLLEDGNPTIAHTDTDSVTTSRLGCPSGRPFLPERLEGIGTALDLGDIRYIDQPFVDASLVQDGPFKLSVQATDNGGVAKIFVAFANPGAMGLDDDRLLDVEVLNQSERVTIETDIVNADQNNEFVETVVELDRTDAQPLTMATLSLEISPRTGIFFRVVATDYSGKVASANFTRLPRAVCR